MLYSTKGCQVQLLAPAFEVDRICRDEWMKKLTDVCDIQYGYAFDSKCFTEDSSYPPLVRIRDVKRGYSETFYSGNYPEEYVLSAGDLLVGMDGEFNIARWKCSGALLNQRVCKLTPKVGINEEFLRFAMSKALKKVEERTAFVTVKHLSAKELNKLELNVPEIFEQDKIADILSKLERVIEERQLELQKLDELIKARFVEMFGNRSDPKEELIDLIINGAGLSYGIVQPGDNGTGDMGVLRPVDMVDGRIAMASIKYIDRSIGDGFKKTELTGDELLITVRGTTGITALTDERFKKMNVTRGIAVVRYDRNKINPVYLNAFLNADESQRYIKEHTRGATLQQINLSDLRVQKIIVPPMELQKQFAFFAEQVAKSKVAVQKALDETQLLFDSLMQQYFG